MTPKIHDYPQTAGQKSKRTRRGSDRAGIFHRSLVREFSGTGLIIFFILFSIVLFTQLARMLGDSVSGILVVEGVLALVGFGALSYIPVLLSVSLFLSVLLTLTRCYRDSEMVVWFCAGNGLTRWVSPVLAYALPVVGTIALLSLVLSPWALSKADEYRRRLESRDDVSAATPGIFRESRHADRVFFIENVEEGNNRVGNVFVQSVQHGKISAMVAREGLQETAQNGDRFLVLLNGIRYEGVPGQGDFKIVEFARYAMRIVAAEVRQGYVWPKTMSTLHLIRNPGNWNISELQRRIGLPVSALILALLAIPMSFVNPRAGRSLNLIMALVIYMLYFNMISVTNTWVGQGKMSATAGLLGIHGLMLAVVILLFYRRTALLSWRRLLR